MQKLFLLLRVCVFVCVCVCVCGISVWFIYNKTKIYFCKMSVFVPCPFFAMFKSAIMEVELDDGGKHDKTTDGGN